MTDRSREPDYSSQIWHEWNDEWIFGTVSRNWRTKQLAVFIGVPVSHAWHQKNPTIPGIWDMAGYLFDQWADESQNDYPINGKWKTLAGQKRWMVRINIPKSDSFAIAAVILGKALAQARKDGLKTKRPRILPPVDSRELNRIRSEGLRLFEQYSATGIPKIFQDPLEKAFDFKPFFDSTGLEPNQIMLTTEKFRSVEQQYDLLKTQNKGFSESEITDLAFQTIASTDAMIFGTLQSLSGNLYKNFVKSRDREGVKNQISIAFIKLEKDIERVVTAFEKANPIGKLRLNWLIDAAKQDYPFITALVQDRYTDLFSRFQEIQKQIIGNILDEVTPTTSIGQTNLSTDAEVSLVRLLRKPACD